MNTNLHQIIESFLGWYIADVHHTKEDAYPELKDKDYLSDLGKSEFIDFFFRFTKEGGMIQSGGHRTAGKFKENLENNFEKFREFALMPYHRKFNIDTWLDKIAEFDYFGSGVATIYLNRINKTRFVIVNNKSKKGLRSWGLKLKVILKVSTMLLKPPKRN